MLTINDCDRIIGLDWGLAQGKLVAFDLTGLPTYEDLGLPGFSNEWPEPKPEPVGLYDVDRREEFPTSSPVHEVLDIYAERPYVPCLVLEHSSESHDFGDDNLRETFIRKAAEYEAAGKLALRRLPCDTQGRINGDTGFRLDPSNEHGQLKEDWAEAFCIAHGGVIKAHVGTLRPFTVPTEEQYANARLVERAKWVALWVRDAPYRYTWLNSNKLLDSPKKVKDELLRTLPEVLRHRKDYEVCKVERYMFDRPTVATLFAGLAATAFAGWDRSRTEIGLGLYHDGWRNIFRSTWNFHVLRHHGKPYRPLQKARRWLGHAFEDIAQAGAQPADLPDKTHPWWESDPEEAPPVVQEFLERCANAAKETP